MVVAQSSSSGRLGPAVAGGLVAAIAGAGLWAAVTAATEYQIGWMAVGVGVLVGFAVRLVGQGTAASFGVAGGALALFGCVLGNLLTVAWFVAGNEGTPYGSFLTSLDPAFAVRMLSATFDPMDLLFYGIAVYCGYKYSTVPGSA